MNSLKVKTLKYNLKKKYKSPRVSLRHGALTTSAVNHVSMRRTIYGSFTLKKLFGSSFTLHNVQTISQTFTDALTTCKVPEYLSLEASRCCFRFVCLFPLRFHHLKIYDGHV